MMFRFFIATLTMLVVFVSAFGSGAGETRAAEAELPLLRTNITVEKALVTLGDIFENTGEKSSIAVFRAPDIGKSGTVRSSRVKAAAQRHGLIWHNPNRVTEIRVTRASTPITVEAVTRVIESAIRNRLALDIEAELTIKLATAQLPVHLPPTDSGKLEIVRLEYSTRSGRFRAELRAADGSLSPLNISFQGQAIESITIPVLTRSILRGEVIQARDIELESLPRHQIRPGILLTESELIGMAARRSLQTGRPLRIDDIEPPKLVRRNTPVIIVYQTEGMTLSIRGRAIADGAMGEMVGVMNVRSSRIIEGVVTGPGRVAIVRLNTLQTSAAIQQRNTHLASSQ